MSITMYQESIPFTNKRTTQPISGNSTYSNPVVMPFAFDFTVATNVLETVIYIRNDDANTYYRNVVITLCKDNLNDTENNAAAYGQIINSNPGLGPYVSIGNWNVPITWSMEQPPQFYGAIYLTGQYTSKTLA